MGTPLRARGTGTPRDLALPPAVHLHGGHIGGVVAELSAGHHNFVDGRRQYTAMNLVSRLFFNKPEVGGRLMQLGCLFCDDNRSGPLGDSHKGSGVPSGDGRSAAQAKADRGAYEAIVNIANYCSAFRLDKACTRLAVLQALHVAERDAHHLVKTVHTAITNNYQKHTVSATHGGAKTTMRTYACYIDRVLRVGRRQPDHRPAATEPPRGRQLPRGRGDAPHRPLCNVGAAAATRNDNLTREREKRQQWGGPVQQQRRRLGAW